MTAGVASAAEETAVRADEKRTVLCTTFPVFQITRNVAKGREGVEVEIMLPSQLGCPHDYVLTPQDMQKLAKADVLVINGLGMEEFLGAPLEKANEKLTIIDSSAGIKEILQYVGGRAHGHHRREEAEEHKDEHEHPFAWAGAFKLEPGVYRWSFAKVDGKYAELSMKMLCLFSEEKEPIKKAAENAVEIFEKDAETLAHGGQMKPGALYVLLFDRERDVSVFDLKIDTRGTYVFFAQHMPYEFEAKEHFFKTADGKDVEPVAEEPEQGHGHHHHHYGTNPHLFASPRMAAKLAMNIAAGLSKADPEGAAVYFKNAQAYAEILNKLADEMASLGKRLKNNRIVQPHGVFDYLARDMGLEVIAVMQPHGQEPSAAEMLELARTIKKKKAGAIFTEPQYPEKVGKALARETGVPVDMLDPVASGPENAPLDYYEKVMRKNMKTIETTLGVK